MLQKMVPIFEIELRANQNNPHVKIFKVEIHTFRGSG